jgi:hypothetical protein
MLPQREDASVQMQYEVEQRVDQQQAVLGWTTGGPTGSSAGVGQRVDQQQAVRGLDNGWTNGTRVLQTTQGHTLLKAETEIFEQINEVSKQNRYLFVSVN